MHRAKTIKTGRWCKGYHFKLVDGKHYMMLEDATTCNFAHAFKYIHEESFAGIDPDTLAQKTGVPDKNKTIIYGSIPINGIMSKGGDKTVSVDGTIFYIEWERGGLGFIGRSKSGIVQLSYLTELTKYNIEILGPACDAKKNETDGAI
ncbi:hypothetical protein LCGC14_0664340 [marine sediment metagenome]|uniref:YopX protein domain-containing protein n=1 Tax=marine sediment metagenome TaxID=412755 RepID=A0A0F9U126_9ZZZZ